MARTRSLALALLLAAPLGAQQAVAVELDLHVEPEHGRVRVVGHVPGLSPLRARTRRRTARRAPRRRTTSPTSPI